METPTQIFPTVINTEGVHLNGEIPAVAPTPSPTKTKLQVETTGKDSSSESSKENSEDDEALPKKDVEELKVLQYPDAGKRRKVAVEDALESDVVTIMPHVKEGRIRTEYEDSVTAVHMKVQEELTGRSQLKVRGYTKYLNCPDYIRRRHEIINGKIDEWRKASLDLLDRVENDRVLGDIYSPGCFFRQRTWAEKIIPNIMLGIDKFSTISVDVLNTDALIHYLDGVDTREEAVFVYHISNCEHFELCVKPMSRANDFTIETIFDHIYGRAFGKRVKVSRLIG